MFFFIIFFKFNWSVNNNGSKMMMIFTKIN